MSLSEMQLDAEVQNFSKRIELINDIDDDSLHVFIKRLIDISGAVLGLLLCLPVFLTVAILIKVEDPNGPLFFKQTRIGKNEKAFQMFKFRSMVYNAEQLLDSLKHLNETSGAMFKIKNDPRVTRIGRLIRRTSIDELPQLWNVLKGEMSLVGPRPPLPNEVEQYTKYDKQRLLVTPGCTGLWQVSGRSNIGFKEMVELDLTYIKQRSIRIDLAIILKTVKVMLCSKDAY